MLWISFFWHLPTGNGQCFMPFWSLKMPQDLSLLFLWRRTRSYHKPQLPTRPCDQGPSPDMLHFLFGRQCWKFQVFEDAWRINFLLSKSLRTRRFLNGFDMFWYFLVLQTSKSQGGGEERAGEPGEAASAWCRGAQRETLYLGCTCAYMCILSPCIILPYHKRQKHHCFDDFLICWLMFFDVRYYPIAVFSLPARQQTNWLQSQRQGIWGRWITA